MTRHGRFDWSAFLRTPCNARITTRLSFSAIMANPRKFSEKIALHNQKQAEETAAFEAIMREVSALPKTPSTHQHLSIAANLGAYRGGSLPNVNQIGNNSIDLQSALTSLEDMKRTGLDRLHRDSRSRQIQRNSPQGSRGGTPFLDKRVDCSPYGSSFLSPPPDGSWRRTHSDSALHTSAMGVNQAVVQQALSHSNTPPTHRRQPDASNQDNSLTVDSSQVWDPKKQLMDQNRPKSCEVPGINIFPSPEQEGAAHSLPISNNTGSLPDLTNLHFPSPMVTPLDAEDQQQQQFSPGGSTGNLSPTSAHHIGRGGTQSPATGRRQPGAPSPLVLQQQQQQQQGGLVQGCIDPHRLTSEHRIHHHHHHPETRLHHQQFRPYQVVAPTHGHVHHHSQGPGRPQVTPPSHAHLSHLQPHSVNSHRSRSQGTNLTQYRNGQTENCPQSPTSPHSQQSYSPSQSPNNLSPSNLSGTPFTEAYYIQQQQQTTALQHQFEQFSMLQDGTLPATNGTVSSLYNAMVNMPNLQYSQANTAGLCSSQEFVDIQNVQNHFNFQQQQQQQQQQQSPSPKPPSSPQHQPQSPSSPQSQHHQQQQQLPSPTATQITLDQHLMNQQGNKIPDIILTGLDWFPLLTDRDREPGYAGVDDQLIRPDLAKELGNAMADSFDPELFPTDEEALKDGLDPLDFAGLQMLTDPNMLTDPATEDTLRLESS